MEREDKLKCAAFLALAIPDCYLCGGPSIMGAVWEPSINNPALGVGCKGNPKILQYGLCKKCLEDADVFSKVEDKAIFEQLVGLMEAN